MSFDHHERLARLQARVVGIRHALSSERLTLSQRREKEQMLKNLELAIQGIQQIAASPATDLMDAAQRASWRPAAGRASRRRSRS